MIGVTISIDLLKQKNVRGDTGIRTVSLVKMLRFCMCDAIVGHCFSPAVSLHSRPGVCFVFVFLLLRSLGVWSNVRVFVMPKMIHISSLFNFC